MLKTSSDIILIIVFFIAFKIAGIYVATIAAMITSLLQLIILWLVTHKIDKVVLFTFIIILLLGGATLFFHNPRFIEWKPSVLYWFLSLIMLYSHIFMKKTVTESLLEKQIKAPSQAFRNINLSWIIYFLAMSVINLYVAYNYSQATWVNFKLFGVIGSSIAMIIVQGIYLSRVMQHDEH